MKELRKRFERFCLRNRGKGIPNLMLYIAVGNLLAYLLMRIDPSNAVYRYLRFDRAAVLHGQVWRLVSYIFTYPVDSIFGPIGSLLILFCLWQIGRILESGWGTFRFNLYLLTGLVLNDVFALIFGWGCSAEFLYMSVFLAVATLSPDARVLLFFFIPVKMKWIAWVYLGITVVNVVLGFRFGLLSFLWLAPVVPLMNYFLFFGSDVQNVLPEFLRVKTKKTAFKSAAQRPNPNWAGSYQSRTGQKPYRHKCTVCGKTDTDYPNLEFRYCSKCSGYYCYCIDHINNHAHIQN